MEGNTMPRFLVAGNWKMNGLGNDITEAVLIAKENQKPNCQTLICPPAILISRMAYLLANSDVLVGGQDCHPKRSGAYTGDHSAEMIADAGAKFIILGHSERRTNYAESNELIRNKIRATWRANLIAIVCVGETEEARNTGQEKALVGAQLEESIPHGASSSNLIVAYEPVWAIGTGHTASVTEIEDMHGFVRQTCIQKLGQHDGQNIKLLYGGSVNPKNAASIFALSDVNGALVGGASLRAAEFLAIINAVPKN